MAAVDLDASICFIPPTAHIAICSSRSSSVLAVSVFFLFSNIVCLNLFVRCPFVSDVAFIWIMSLLSPSGFAASSQILELAEEPRGLPPEFHEVHHQLALPPLPLHRGLCSAGHAALWRTVSNLSSALTLLPSSLQHRHTCSHTRPILYPRLHLTLLPVCDPWPGVAVLTDMLTQQVAGRAAAPTAALWYHSQQELHTV